MRPHVVTVGLNGVSRLGNVKIDHALLTILVDQWHKETHLPVGEGIVMLQDDAILLCLRIDGHLLLLTQRMIGGPSATSYTV